MATRPSLLSICPTRLRPVGLALAAVVLAISQTGGARAQAPAQPQPSAVPVQVTQAVRKDVPILLRNIGTVQAFQSVLVRARVDGTLDEVLFQEGQEVRRGDRLAQIDPRPYAAALAQAVAKRAADAAQLANARNDLSRYQTLSRKDFASHQQVDTQAATVAQLEATLQGDDAQIATARLNLDFCNITSPIDGRVGLRMVDPGNLIHANDAQGIVTVDQIHPISVIFTLPQDTLPQVQAAMAKGKLPVQAWSADDQRQLDTGELLTVDNNIDQGTGTYRLKAVFPNKDNQLWPGQFVNARLQTGTRPGVVTVPSVAVQHGPDGLYVFMIKPDQTAAMRPVEVAQDDGRMAVIAKGLDDGAQVVVKGVSRLQDGTQVAPTKVSS